MCVCVCVCVENPGRCNGCVCVVCVSTHVCICACGCVEPGPSQHQAPGVCRTAAVAVGNFSTRRRTAPSRKGRVGGGRSQNPELARPSGHCSAQVPTDSASPCTPHRHLSRTRRQYWEKNGGRGRKANTEKERQKPEGQGLITVPPSQSLLEHVSRVKLPSRAQASACCSRGRPSVNCPTAQARK